MRSFEKLPEYMQNDAVKRYYDIVHKKVVSRVLKRLFDIILSIIIIIILLIPMVIISCIVGLGSKGGVIFKQKRVTAYGKTFYILKFRTMISGADKKGSQVTAANDSRITPQGRVLRKLRLDELPQIFNVLKGDMSIVGTRPEVPKYVEKYTPEMYATLLLPAGITSPASIKFKNEQELLKNSSSIDADYVEKVLPEKMKYNLEYTERFNIFYDLKVIIATFFGVFFK